MMNICEKVFVAVDTHDFAKAKDIIAALHGQVAGVKLGLEFYMKFGAEGIDRLMRNSHMKLFLDLKLHDIPNTVVGALDTLKLLHPEFITIHGAGGRDMLAQSVQKLSGSGIKILAVSLLTSLDSQDLKQLGIEISPAQFVENIAKLASDTGVDGIVCSANEAGAISANTPNLIRMVPGIRPKNSAQSDQKRTATPLQALLSGASYLVIGRPITESKNIQKTLDDINNE